MTDEARLAQATGKLLLETQKRSVLTPAPSAVSRFNRSSEGVDPLPLSFSQEQVWRLDQTAGKLAPLHNESITIHRHGPCDILTLERSLAEIIRRHEIWRTTYGVVQGQPVQIVHAAPAVCKLPFSDLRTLPEGEREQKALELATRDAAQPFDLQRGPLLRGRLVTLDDTEHRFYLTAHQSIIDGVIVFYLFPTELTTIYESSAAGNPSPLPELEVQYADFACWQRRSLSGDVLENQLAYWQNQLRGELRVLQWPNEFARQPGRHIVVRCTHSSSLGS
jgi:hypothetical protein